MTDTKNWYPTAEDVRFAQEVLDKIDNYIPPWVTPGITAIAMLCQAMTLDPAEIHCISVGTLIH
ncbi:MAG: hypothetical protein FWE98_07045 [Oscillospiraceae bacterium]|nr:hypothetical protein [Oscillospiraceae bacterium]